MKTMTTGLCALWLSLSLVGPLQGQARPPRDLVLGKDVRFELAPPALSGSSTRISGELLSVTDDSLTVLVDSGLRTVPLAQIRSLELARHRFGWRKVLTWTAIGAGVTGVGLTLACNSYEDSERCGGVFLGTSLSWLLYGGLAGAGIDGTRWRSMDPSRSVLAPHARYPQGIPESRRGEDGGSR